MATPRLRARAHRDLGFRHAGFEPLQLRLMLAGDTCRDHNRDDDTPQDVAAALTGNNLRAADAGSTMGTAYDLGELGSTQLLPGSVGLFDPSDLMSFTLNEAKSVSLSLRGLQADIDLYLFDSSGRLLAWSDRVGNASESISATLEAGEYYVLVSPWQAAASFYVFSASATPLVPAPSDPPSSPSTDPAPSDPASPIAALPDVAYYGGANDWNLNSINAPEAWAAGYTGQGVVVAVVDTGVDVNHPDLMSQLFVNAGEIAGNGLDDDGNGFVDDVSGWDFAAGDNNPDDANGHGTHVAGTIAAARNGSGATGVAPGASILPVRVLGDDGSGSVSSVAAGIRYAVDMGADIINLSLGGSYSSLILSAIQYAVSNNVLVVAASGNEYARTPGYPARFSASLSSVLSVGAYNSSGTIAGFSNDVGSSGAVQVDAPGVNVYSTYAGGGYGRLSGTSMATPHVAGLAALALSAHPNLTAAQLRSLITSGADQAVNGSDSLGGINAALTVARAAAGQSSSAANVSSASSASSAASVSVRSFLVSSAIPTVAGQGLAAASSTFGSSSVQSSAAPTTVSVPARIVAVDAAFALLESADQVDSIANAHPLLTVADELEELYASLTA